MNTILLILLLNLQISTGITEPTPTEQTYQKIGYTTQYGNGFNNTPTFDYTSSRPGQPRRSPQKPFSGNWWEDFEDWCRMNDVPVIGRLLGYDEDWPSYVERDYWEQFLKEHDEYYDEVWNYYQTHPDKPNNPFVPIGDPSLFAILGLLFLWIAFDILKHMANNDDQ